MRRKGPRDIPDFSRKRPPAQSPPAPEQDAKVVVPHRPPPPAQVKPQATSAKSGRRGQ